MMSLKRIFRIIYFTKSYNWSAIFTVHCLLEAQPQKVLTKKYDAIMITLYLRNINVISGGWLVAVNDDVSAVSTSIIKTNDGNDVAEIPA